MIRVFDGLPKVQGEAAGGQGQDSLSLQIDRREIYRYMGVRTGGLAILDETVTEVCTQLLRVCRMKAVSRRMPVQFCFDGQMAVHSRQLAKNLQHCREVFLFGATLGPEADRMISRESRRDMSRGLVCEAAATALIEAYCDVCQQAIAAEVCPEGKLLRPRFSPGYGDLDIHVQPEILRLLDAPRKIGLTLTEGCMLAPAKSVTAFIGIGDRDATAAFPTGCAACKKADCAYRRKG